MTDSKDYTVFIRNFDSQQVTHDILLELFTQAGPVQNLTLKEDFAFLEFEDKESVMYSCNLLNDTVLFGMKLQVKPRNGSIFENTEFYKFPNQIMYNDYTNDYQQSYDDMECRLNNSDYRQYNQSNSNSYNNNEANNYRYQCQTQQSINNSNSYRSHNNRLFVENEHRGFKHENKQSMNRTYQEGRFVANHDNPWFDKRTFANRSFGNYRDKPY